ncbi:MAG: PAS domain-containing protein, partial [Thiobacillus sp.]|nr:PAS domain-containing protein [Thiobacillus sp.]
MRSNLPVTHVEYVLSDTETVVSKTDLHGNITYVNQDFINISGFSEAELLGAPQNIVRHPDMPVEAFEDFWRTVKSGKAWTGLVKNRCKNGDHYWVEANAAPLIENGNIVGYTSIRTKPGREQVQAAESAYRAIKAGDSSLKVEEGNAVRPSLLQRCCLDRLGGLSLKAVLLLASVSTAILFGVMAILA